MNGHPFVSFTMYERKESRFTRPDTASRWESYRRFAFRVVDRYTRMLSKWWTDIGHCNTHSIQINMWNLQRARPLTQQPLQFGMHFFRVFSFVPFRFLYGHRYCFDWFVYESSLVIGVWVCVVKYVVCWLAYSCHVRKVVYISCIVNRSFSLCIRKHTNVYE